MDDQEATDEARQLVQYADRIWWRLAELTWHAIRAGKDPGRWAREIGVPRRVVSRGHQLWARYGSLPAGDRPSYAEAWRMIASGHGGPASDAEPP
jgi:hypothetical protein